MIIYDYDNLYFVFVHTIFRTNMGECGKVFGLYYLLGQDGTSNGLMCSAIHPHSFASILML